MASQIDPTVPADGIDIIKAQFRANFAQAKAEIEALQAGVGSGAIIGVWRAGSGVPNNSLGLNDDYYHNLDNEDVYRKAGGVYSLVGNLAGGGGGGTSYTQVDDAGNYTATPFVPGTGGADQGENRRFTAAGTQLINFDGTAPADSYGRFRAGSGVALSIRSAAGVTVNGVAARGASNDIEVGPGGSVWWERADDGTYQVSGDTDETIVLLSIAETSPSASVSGSTTIDFKDGSSPYLTLTGNITPTFTNLPGSGLVGSMLLFLQQGGSGSNAVTWPAGTKYEGGTPPTLSTTVGAIDMLMVVARGGSLFVKPAGLNWS